MASRAQQIRDLKIELDADARKLEAGFERARRSTMRLEDQLRKADLAAAQLDKQLADEAGRAAAQRAQSVEHLGRALAGFGLAAAAGLGMATAAAINWESAWAGVTKTVDGSPEQMAALETELRNLATTLPATHAEIAAVAEAAGQLGVQREAITSFTKTMIDLSETTNLTADAAATAIAQLGNVLRLDLKEDVDNFGAALVALGNDGASTEADILSMAQRIGGAGSTIGLSAQDVLGFAAALSNVGIEAEAGGSSISTAMVKIAESVEQGGDKLDTFAQVAGMTAEEFTRAFEADPARAIAAFIEGLGGVEAAGGSVFATLESVGLSEIRVRDAMLRLSQSTRGVTTDLDLAAEAWDENTALIKEAEARYDTAEAKIQVAKNTLVEMGINIGEHLLPVLIELVESGADLVGWFNDLPGPVQAAVAALGTAAGAAALAAGGFLLLAPRLQAARTQMDLLAVSAPKVAAGLRALTFAGGAVGVLLAIAGAVTALAEATDDAPPSIAAVTEDLLNLRDGLTGGFIQDMLAAREQIENFDNGMLKIAHGQALDEWRAGLEAADTALAQMAQSGNADVAADSALAFAESLGFTGQAARDFLEAEFPQYQDALTALENDSRIASEATNQFGEAIGILPGQTDPAIAAMEELASRFGITGDDAVKAAEQMLEEWGDAIGSFVSITDAYDTALSAKEESERATAQATADATEDQSDSWEDFAGDVTLTVDEYLTELERMVENQQLWRDNMVTLTGRVSDEMLGYLASLGPEGADLVALYAQMTDEELQHAETLWRKSTDEGVQGIIDELINGGPILRQIAADHGEDVANNVRDYMIKNQVGVAQAAAALGVAIDTNIPDSHNTATTVTPPSASNFASVLKTIRDHFAGVTVPLKFGDPGFGVIGGGSGGSGGGAVSGGWRTPLSSGTYRVGSPFGMRNGRMHTGQDLPARTGTPIFAARAGRVSRAATLSGSYGNHVYIDHGGGWQTRYAHMSARFVRAGQAVGSGHRLGQVGSTGNSTGPHLHFEVRSGGRALNPRNYVRFARGGPIEGPGGPRDDMVPIWASDGEFMHQEAAVRHYGRDFMHAINDRRLPKFWEGGGVGGVASTTPVRPSAGPASVTLDPGALATALDGTSMTLLIDGAPVRGIIQTQITEHERGAVRRLTAGVKR
jgi:TP901 family phage tail tape measure protein